ncbi:unnamed protein product [Schistosoma margrebowiei]|uniref:Uncharacterized protein n=1 Tax=Schistosoma margrebowiei TaxID=48269 RepID=A0A3P8CCY4_9TREM|nr:unnamed protein product [Schistosoma margrebowiei]
MTPSTLIFLKISNHSRLSIDYYFSITKIITVYKFQKFFDYVFEKYWQLKYSIKQFGLYLILSIRKTFILNRICKCIIVKLNKSILFIIFNNSIHKLCFLIIYLKFIIRFLLITYYISYNTQSIKHLIYTNVNNHNDDNDVDDGDNDHDDDDDYVEREPFIKSSIFQSNKSKSVKSLSLSNVLSRKNTKKVRNISRLNVLTYLIWIIIIILTCTIKTIESIEQIHHSPKLSNEYNLINLLQSLTTIEKQMNLNILTKSEQKTWNYLIEKLLKSQINMIKNNPSIDYTSSITTISSSLSSMNRKQFNNNNNIQKPSKEELIAKTPNYMFKLHERHMNDWHSFGRYESNHLLHPDYVKYLNENSISIDNIDLYKEKKQKTHHNRHHLGMITAIRHHKHIDWKLLFSVFYGKFNDNFNKKM